MKRTFKRFILAIIIIIIIGIAYLAFSLQHFYSKTFLPQQKSAQAQNNRQTVSLDKPFNVLLLGYGGGNHDGAYLTDSMIVVHNDPSTKTLYLISIPRDIWVQISTNTNKSTYWKINAAYELGLDDHDYPNKPEQFKGPLGGGNMVKFAVNQVTGLTIDRFIAMDFSGFKSTIDSLGGVDVTVEKTFDDYEYPIDGNEDDLCGHQPSDLPELEKIATISATKAFPCRYKQLHFDQGAQHMNGETALAYVRSRHSAQDGTDFGRSRRQRNLITATKQKFFSINAIQSILPLINSLQDDFKTDFSLAEIQAIVPSLNDNPQKYSFQSLALTNQNVLIDEISSDGQAILVPKDGTYAWDSVHQWLKASLEQTQTSLTNSSPIIKIENGTHIPGLAALAVNRLQDKDFNVLPSSNADDQSYEKTVIYVDGSHIDQAIINDIKGEFNVFNIGTKSLLGDNCNILVIVGKDYNSIQGKKVINE